MRRMHIVVLLLVLVGAVTSGWYRPAGGASTTRPELVLQLGHSGPVGSVAYSRDGKRVVTGSEDGTVRIWDPQSGEMVRMLRGKVGGQPEVALSPDGRTIAVGRLARHEPAAIELWDGLTGKRLRALKGDPDTGTFLVFSRDGKILAGGGEKLGVRLWEVRTGRLLRTLPAGAPIAFLPAGGSSGTPGLLACYGRRDGVDLWDASTGRLKRTLRPGGGPHSARPVGGPHPGQYWQKFAFSPDGKTLAAGVQAKLIRLLDVATGKPQGTLRGHRLAVFALAFSRDGRMLASGDSDEHGAGEVILWDLTASARKPGSQRSIIPRKATGVHSSIVPVAFSFSPDGATLAIGTWDPDVELRDTRTGNVARTLAAARSDAVYSYAFSSGGRKAAVGGDPRELRLWDLQRGVLERTVVGLSSAWSVALSADGRALASGDENGNVRYWDLRRADSPAQTLVGHGAGVEGVAFSADGQQLATGSGEWNADEKAWEVKLWDLSSGRAALVRTLSECTPPVAFSRDGATLAAVSHDQKHVQIRSAPAGTLLRTLAVRPGPVSDVAISPDGNLVAVSGWGGELGLWDARTGAALRTLTSSPTSIDSVAFSSDGRNVAGGGSDGTVKVWEVQTGRRLRTLVGHDSGVIAVGFLAEGRILASGGDDHSIKVWEVSSGRLLATLLLLPPNRQGEVGAEWISFTPEGYYTASPGANRFIRWRVGGRPGEPVRLLPAEAHEATLRRPDLVERALRGEMLPPP